MLCQVYNWLHHQTRVLPRQAVISAGTFLLADLSAQSQEGRDYATLDGKRMLRCAAVGLLLHGPMCHVFFGKLDRELIISKVCPYVTTITH